MYVYGLMKWDQIIITLKWHWAEAKLKWQNEPKQETMLDSEVVAEVHTQAL